MIVRCARCLPRNANGGCHCLFPVVYNGDFHMRRWWWCMQVVTASYGVLSQPMITTCACTDCHSLLGISSNGALTHSHWVTSLPSPSLIHHFCIKPDFYRTWWLLMEDGGWESEHRRPILWSRKTDVISWSDKSEIGWWYKSVGVTGYSFLSCWGNEWLTLMVSC